VSSQWRFGGKPVRLTVQAEPAKFLYPSAAQEVVVRRSSLFGEPVHVRRLLWALSRFLRIEIINDLYRSELSNIWVADLLIFNGMLKKFRSFFRIARAALRHLNAKRRKLGGI